MLSRFSHRIITALVLFGFYLWNYSVHTCCVAISGSRIERISADIRAGLTYRPFYAVESNLVIISLVLFCIAAFVPLKMLRWPVSIAVLLPYIIINCLVLLH